MGDFDLREFIQSNSGLFTSLSVFAAVAVFLTRLKPRFAGSPYPAIYFDLGILSSFLMFLVITYVVFKVLWADILDAYRRFFQFQITRSQLELFLFVFPFTLLTTTITLLVISFFNQLRVLIAFVGFFLGWLVFGMTLRQLLSPPSQKIGVGLENHESAQEETGSPLGPMFHDVYSKSNFILQFIFLILLAVSIILVLNISLFGFQVPFPSYFSPIGNFVLIAFIIGAGGIFTVTIISRFLFVWLVRLGQEMTETAGEPQTIAEPLIPLPPFKNERGVIGKITLGFVFSGIILLLLGTSIGWGQISNAFSSLRFTWVAFAMFSSFVGLLAWSKAWHVILKSIGIDTPHSRLAITYLSATFANYLTPYGQAGGEPFIAYVLSQDIGASYEDGLTSVVIADLTNLIPFFHSLMIGLSALFIHAEVPNIINPLIYGFTALAIAFPVLVYLIWVHQHRIERWIPLFISPLTNLSSRLSTEGIKYRVSLFFDSLNLLARDSRKTGITIIYSYAGWIFFIIPLYMGALALNLSFQPLLILFIVPLSTIAGFVPTPGGLGAVEAALVVTLLISVPALTSGQAFAIALIYRIATYWTALVIGMLSSFILLNRQTAAVPDQ